MSKYCPQCGTGNPDEGKFCRNCGTPLIVPAANADSQRQAANGPMQTNGRAANGRAADIWQQAPQPKKPLNKKLIIGLAAAAAAAVVVILLLLNMGKTIDLTKYVNIRYEGPDGYAVAYTDIDTDQLYTDALSALGYSEKDLSSMGYGDSSSMELGDIMNMAGNYSKIMQDMSEVETLVRYMEVVLDKTENISNGDKITAVITYTGTGKKLNVKGGQKTFDVAGLTEVREIDPFSGIEIVFSGVEPYGTAVLEGTDKYSDYGIYYSLDKDSGLSKGDKVTVTVSCDEDYLLEQGYHITADTKEYTVDKLDEAQGIDLFEGIDVSYEGVAPFARPYLEESGRYVNNGNGGNDIYVSFEIGDDRNVDIGDTVLVKASYDAEQFARNGIIARSDTKQYTVGGIDRYVQLCSELDETLMANIKRECEDRLEAYFAGINDDTFSHSGEEYAGAYLLTAKQNSDAWYSTPNMLYILYKGTARSANENSKVRGNTRVYYAFSAEDVIQHADGTQSYDETTLKMLDVDNSDIVLNWGNINAYSDVQDAYADLVSKHKDKYTCDVSSDAVKNGAGSEAKAAADTGNEAETEYAEEAAEEKPEAEEPAAEEPAEERPAQEEPSGENPAAEEPAQPSDPHEGEVQIRYGLYAPESDFIFPYSSTNYLSYEEIDAKLQDPDQNTRYRNGQLAINEILARYGYPFDPASERIGARDAAEKFGGKSWYQQAMKNCGYDDPYALIGDMNEVEKANIKAITAWQEANDADEMK